MDVPRIIKLATTRELLAEIRVRGADLATPQMLAVVEAARSVAEAERYPSGFSAAEHGQRTLALISAVDAYETA